MEHPLTHETPLVVWRSKNSGFSGINEEGQTLKEGCPNWSTKPQRICRKLRLQCRIGEKSGHGNDWKGNGKDGDHITTHPGSFAKKEREDGAHMKIKSNYWRLG